MAATLTCKVSESIILDNQNYSSTRINTIASINEISKRIVTVPSGGDTTIATFAATVSTSVGAYDVNDVRYIRITNLDSSNPVNIALVGASDNAQFVVKAGESLIFGTPDDFMLGEEDTTPAFASFEDLASIIVDSASNAVDVELFIASV
jgi:hypothetical protein